MRLLLTLTIDYFLFFTHLTYRTLNSETHLARTWLGVWRLLHFDLNILHPSSSNNFNAMFIFCCCVTFSGQIVQMWSNLCSTYHFFYNSRTIMENKPTIYDSQRVAVFCFVYANNNSKIILCLFYGCWWLLYVKFILLIANFLYCWLLKHKNQEFIVHYVFSNKEKKLMKIMTSPMEYWLLLLKN